MVFVVGGVDAEAAFDVVVCLERDCGLGLSVMR